jgi:hypothetical protein
MRGACVEGLRDMQPTKNVERIMIHEAPHLVDPFRVSGSGANKENDKIPPIG